MSQYRFKPEVTIRHSTGPNSLFEIRSELKPVKIGFVPFLKAFVERVSGSSYETQLRYQKECDLTASFSKADSRIEKAWEKHGANLTPLQKLVASVVVPVIAYTGAREVANRRTKQRVTVVKN